MRRPAGGIGIGDLVLMTVGVAGVSMSGPLMAAIAAPALAIAFWRNTFATAVILPTALVRHRTEVAALGGRALGMIAVSGLMLAGHFATWATALKMTSVASATALVSLQAAWVVLLSWLTGERASTAVVVGLALSLAGVVVVSGVDVTVSTRALAGDGLAVAGGLFGAVYVLVGGTVRRRTSTPTYTVACYGVCAVTLLVACLAGGQQLVGYRAFDWWRLVALTLAAQLFGHTVFNHLLARVSPTVVSLVLLLEVPGAALIAAAFLGQSPPAGVYAGLVLVLCGLGIVVARRSPQPEEAPVD